MALFFGRSQDLNSFVPQIALHVQNYFVPAVAHHLWSLAVEEHFYLLIGVAVWWLTRTKKSKTLASWYWVPLTLMSAAPILRIVAVYLGEDPGAIQIQTHYRLDGLSAGVLLAMLSVYRPEKFRRLLEFKWLWVAAALSGYGFLWFVPKDSSAGVVVGFSVSYLAGAAFILFVHKSRIEVVLPSAARILAFLGIYSYALYIWHVPVSRVLAKSLSSTNLSLPPAAVISLDYVCSIVVAVFMSRLIEFPMMWVRDRLFPNPVHAV
ncbi:acyltransferase [Aquincola tertiaricarbonis]|uniref:Acyltransferase n=2 Tax=Aquincola tertiaricarbonis TaxID=391953 RepID=A0ABY4SA73_AQUTE|nr:acyltransferase [Aquincola tertiaricarbonis]